jgi:serine/threonine protein kinase
LDDRLRARLANFGLVIEKETMLWMAPELFKRTVEVTAAADIWSLGMVLWELASREIPFKNAQNQLQAMGWIKDGKKEEIPSGCPSELKTMIERYWDLTPMKRPTAGQLVEHLKWVTDREQKAQTPMPLLARKSPQQTDCRRLFMAPM